LFATKRICILYFVHRATRYNRVMKTKLMHNLSLIYFVNQPLHVSGMFVVSHHEVYYTYTTTEKHNT